MSGSEEGTRAQLDGAMSWLRMAVVLLASLSVTDPLASREALAGLWLAGVTYAALVIAARPQRFVSARVWWGLTGMIDWLLISIGIVLDGGARSDLYLLYFVLAFGAGVRFGLAQAVFCGLGTALSYFGLMLLVSDAPGAIAATIAMRGGYLATIAFGCGLLAREAERHTRAELARQAEEVATRGIASALSGEIRNPLAAASGLIDIALHPSTGPLTVQQRTLLMGVDGNIERAGNLVRNLIDAERIDSGTHGFSPRLADLNASVRRAVDPLARQLEAKQIGLLLNLTPSLPLTTIDTAWLDQALRNILINALELTPERGALRLSTAKSGESLVVEVWNSGSAVSPRLAPVLFKKFVRDSQSRGVGLGLYVTKAIVDLHGGQIAARNVADGVAFVIEIPCGQQQPSLIPVVDSDAWELRRHPALAQ